MFYAQFHRYMYFRCHSLEFFCINLKEVCQMQSDTYLLNLHSSVTGLTRILILHLIFSVLTPL